MGIYKPKAYSQGGWGKYRKINTFKIIVQNNIKAKLNFKIFGYEDVKNNFKKKFNRNAWKK